jgi:Domain of unknown function (DUF1737).
MDTIEEYKTLNSPELRLLDDQVTAALIEGWQPYGPPFVSAGVALYCQAVVKFRRPTGEETIVAHR